MFDEKTKRAKGQKSVCFVLKIWTQSLGIKPRKVPMVDFSQLLKSNTSEQERQANLDAQNERFLESLREKMQERSDRAHALLDRLDGMSEHEQNFVKDLCRASEKPDASGVTGAKLADLSDKQLDWLERLEERHLRPKRMSP